MVLEEILSFFPFLSFAVFPNFMPISIQKRVFFGFSLIFTGLIPDVEPSTSLSLS